MMPRSWNDFGPFSFASISTSLVDAVTGDGSGDGRGEGFFASSGFTCIEVECFNFFNSFPSSLSVLPWAFRFMNGAILRYLENPSWVLKYFFVGQNFDASTIDKSS